MTKQWSNNVFHNRKVERNNFRVFAKFCKHLIKMETQKIVNLLNSSENEYSKFATKKWYIIDSESKGVYSHENPIKFYACILVTGNIAATGADGNTKFAFKNCAPFRKYRTEINETFIDETEHISIAMCNLCAI